MDGAPHSSPSLYDRQRLLARAESEGSWDLVIIGGGATGVGAAVDGAARGLRVLLVEQSDFGKATSSRSTKLIHGGVRYLRQGNLGLVRSALVERALLRRLAPHVVYDLPLVIPTYQFTTSAYYRLGLGIYDWLAGRHSLGHSQRLSRAATVEHLPTIRRARLRGGVLFFDGAFDDARLLINLVQTAVEQGAVCVNYLAATQLLKHRDRVCGVVLKDQLSERQFTAEATVVVNATGPFVDNIRHLDDPLATPIIAPSQGVHIVLPQSVLPGDTALLVPRTPDGRVLFAIPWHGRVVVGTTDTPRDHVPLEPRALPEEIDFLLSTTAQYLETPPSRSDILSAVAGIRPLVRSADAKKTASLARDHLIVAARSGLITVTGGKWTTYRKMAKDCIDQAVEHGRLTARPCQTDQLRIHGHAPGDRSCPWAFYGTDAGDVQRLCREVSAYDDLLDDRLPYRAGQVVWAVRHEMARTVDDVLARRTRALWLDARAAIDAAPRVAKLMADQLHCNSNWQQQQVAAFRMLAEGYVVEHS